MMDIGPVLHADDVVAGKMSALYTRAEPRDFLDVDAAVTTGRYTRTRLLELAEQADAGFDRRILADLFGMLERYPDRRFTAYSAAEQVGLRNDLDFGIPSTTDDLPRSILLDSGSPTFRRRDR
jgi:Nucleotidyl transferase AbiEii toxin, Type IV TA system